MIKYWILGHKT